MATNQGKGYGTQSILGRGGVKKWQGGHGKFYPYKKGRAEKVLAVLKWAGGTKSFEVVLTL